MLTNEQSHRVDEMGLMEAETTYRNGESPPILSVHKNEIPAINVSYTRDSHSRLWLFHPTDLLLKPIPKGQPVRVCGPRGRGFLSGWR